ncbi:unnamed protein product [Coffea canephora]|uniref:DUF569 domain-containing protein n=1 Tax=Coffea canephora TaxID=49390 RepID=A0A068U3N2_COFCA|nr:unnamed protein product [Coffea canephora]
MELLAGAKIIRLRTHKGKYLIAGDDEESVRQDRDGSMKQARWRVEFVDGNDGVRLKSCYGKYLTATNEPILGMEIILTGSIFSVHFVDVVTQKNALRLHVTKRLLFTSIKSI